MRILLLAVSIVSFVCGQAKLNLDHAIYSKTLQSSDYFALKSGPYIRFFSYKSELKPNRFAPAQSLESHYQLMVEQHNQSNAQTKLFSLNFFENTHGLKAVSTNGPLALLAALTTENQLKTALVDNYGNTKSGYTHYQNQYDKIVKIFKAKDGTFFMLLESSHVNDRSQYFDRGLSKHGMTLIHLNANLRPLMTKNFGSVGKEQLIDGIMNNNQHITVLSQTGSDSFNLYTIKDLDESINKTKWQLPQEDTLQSLHRSHDNHIILGGSKSTLYQINKTIKTIPLSDMHQAQIKDISQIQNNQWLLSGFCISPKGDQDGFITFLDANFSTVWVKKIQTSYNDAALSHSFSDDKLHLMGQTFTQDGAQKLLHISISKAGYPIKPKPIETLKEKFVKELKKRIGTKYQKYIDILPASDIIVTNYYNPQSHTISPKVEADLIQFFHHFIDVASDNKYSKDIKTIYFNGFSSSEWYNETPSKRFLNNAKLSQERSFALLDNLIKNIKDPMKRHWLEKHVVLRSFSSNQTIQNDQKLENFEKSRRATLSIEWK